jgi:hypothetical protein
VGFYVMAIAAERHKSTGSASVKDKWLHRPFLYIRLFFLLLFCLFLIYPPDQVKLF